MLLGGCPLRKLSTFKIKLMGSSCFSDCEFFLLFEISFNKLFHVFSGLFREAALLTPKKKKSLVSGNAGDEKNLHPGSRKFIFLSIFRRYSLFFFNFFCFFYSCFLFVYLFVLLENKDVYSDTHSTIRAGE